MIKQRMATVDLLDKNYDEQKIWRYIDYWKLKKLIKSHSLYFTSISKLEKEDSQEGMPSKLMSDVFDKIDKVYNKKVLSTIVNKSDLKPDTIIYDWRKSHEAHKKQVYVNCWTKKKEESWMWANYTKCVESVAIQSTYGRLKKCFNGKGDYLFIKTIQYIDHDKSVNFSGHGTGHFTKKNIRFRRESELRIIFDYRMYRNQPKSHGICKSVDLTTLIQSIVCKPNSPPEFLAKVKKLVESNSLDIKITKSKNLK